MEKPVYVKMLGKFLISHNGRELSESKLKMNQLVTLITYLIYNSNKHLFLDNIYNVLWPDESSDNPAHAFRNLIYRARTVLKQNLDENIAYIVTLENNSYCWNKELETVCDTVVFEKYIKIASGAELSNKKKIENYLKAEELYNGDFLLSLSNQDWIVPISTYYRHMYSKAVTELTELLIEEKCYDDALKVCLKATEIDPFDEKAHQKIIQIYNSLDKNDLAKKHYNYISNFLYRELGVGVSMETRALYDQIKVKNSIETDIKAVRRILTENDNLDIPLFCSYEVLKCIYSLQVRNLRRRDDSQFLFLMTINTKSGGVPPAVLLQKEKIRLTEILKLCLRKNDVVADYSDSQFILMLSSLSFENAEMVRSRIEKEFEKGKGQTMISYSILAIN